MSNEGVRRLRARALSMVYQNPGAALNPSIRVGEQIAEMFAILGAGKDEALDRTRAMLAKVQISDPARVMRRYPHQLSGGMQQRAVIAMALAKDPTLLILDEPTTGLDATVEAEVLDLIASLRKEFGTSVLFISHNLGVIRKMCERVGVLYAGRLVEEGPTCDAARRPTPSVHRGPASLHPPWRPAQGPRPARHHPRLPAPARRAPPRVRLRRPLPDRDRHLPHGRAAVPRARRRPLEPVPLPRAGRFDTSCDAAATRSGADGTNGSHGRGAPRA